MTQVEKQPVGVDPWAVIKAVRDGKLSKDVAADFGLTKGRVSQILTELDPGAIEAGRQARLDRDRDLIDSISRAWNDDEPVELIAQMHEMTPAQVYEFVALSGTAKARPTDPTAVQAAFAAGASTSALRKCFGVSRQRLHQIKIVELERRVS